MELDKRQTVSKALILIPDIGGFTQFNLKTDIIIGKNILTRALQSIIKSNFLNLRISEIEGDAVFFHKYGVVPDFTTILDQYENMLINFKTALHQVHVGFHHETDLTLKMIVHYGDVVKYNINNFKKIYGEVVTEAHILLKSPVKTKNYVLFTEQALEASGYIPEAILPNWIKQEEMDIKRDDGVNLHIRCFTFDVEDNEFKDLYSQNRIP